VTGLLKFRAMLYAKSIHGIEMPLFFDLRGALVCKIRGFSNLRTVVGIQSFPVGIPSTDPECGSAILA
jgi:hypothetical protein